jgi:hypothetical protein
MDIINNLRNNHTLAIKSEKNVARTLAKSGGGKPAPA